MIRKIVLLLLCLLLTSCGRRQHLPVFFEDPYIAYERRMREQEKLDLMRQGASTIEEKWGWNLHSDPDWHIGEREDGSVGPIKRKKTESNNQ